MHLDKKAVASGGNGTSKKVDPRAAKSRSHNGPFQLNIGVRALLQKPAEKPERDAHINQNDESGTGSFSAELRHKADCAV